ncbi:MAG: YdaU family protein [Patescibacteria group bacterium]|nr:YdaU family protein [Patescibacteria group bacterium]
MKPDTWMPLYWADFLADTLHLSRADIGSYMLLIGAYWRKGGPLPADDQALQMICRCPGTEWACVRGVMVSFFTVENNVWRHKRIDKELAESREMFNARVERTKAATEARRRQQEQRNVQRNVERDDVGDEQRGDDGNKDVNSNVALTQPQPQPQPQPHIQSHSQSPTGNAPAKQLSVAETVKFDGELKRVTRELEKLGALENYDKGTRKYNRIIELTNRQVDLRKLLGVKA